MVSGGDHYRWIRRAKGGSWVARLYLEGRYCKSALGKADDVTDADGVAILSYQQAQEKARAWFARERRRAAGLEPMPNGPYTVRDAITDYLSWFADNRKAASATTAAANAHILPAFGNMELSRLTPAILEKWLAVLAKSPARLRSRKGKPVKHRETGNSPEAVRQRRASANRVLTILKAALNHAWRAGKVANDDAWRGSSTIAMLALPWCAI
jgi:hypothetical protein